MKNIFLMLIVFTALFFNSCQEEPWNEGDPAMEHIYYFGFEDWGKLKNDVKFTVVQGETLAVPVQFHSEQVRSYDVTTFYYVAGTAVRGADYQIVDANGTALNPDANGAFSLVWPQAVKGVQTIYVKALNGSTGNFLLQTFDPNAEVPISNTDPTSATNNKTNDYEVRAFSQNHKVSITIK